VVLAYDDLREFRHIQARQICASRPSKDSRICAPGAPHFGVLPVTYIRNRAPEIGQLHGDAMARETPTAKSSTLRMKRAEQTDPYISMGSDFMAE